MQSVLYILRPQDPGKDTMMEIQGFVLLLYKLPSAARILQDQLADVSGSCVKWYERTSCAHGRPLQSAP